MRNARSKGNEEVCYVELPQGAGCLVLNVRPLIPQNLVVGGEVFEGIMVRNSFIQFIYRDQKFHYRSMPASVDAYQISKIAIKMKRYSPSVSVFRFKPRC